MNTEHTHDALGEYEAPNAQQLPEIVVIAFEDDDMRHGLVNMLESIDAFVLEANARRVGRSFVDFAVLRMDSPEQFEPQALANDTRERVLIFAPQCAPVEALIEPSLEVKQTIVCDLISFVEVGREGVNVVCADDFLGMPFNRSVIANGTPLFGTFLCVGVIEETGDNRSLTDDEINFLKEHAFV